MFFFCTVLSIDAMDVSGEQQIDVDHNILKQRLDLLGLPITESPVKESKHFIVFCVMYEMLLVYCY